MKEINSLSELQSIEKNILYIFIDFCKKNNLKYYLCFGSLLGAVRHNDMIPWDDDIDICMPRKDYDLLIELTKNNKINEYIDVYNSMNDKTSWDLILRIYDNRTIIVKPDIGYGVYIDIHPLDIFPTNNIIKQIWILWIWINKKGMYFAKRNFKNLNWKIIGKLMLCPIIFLCKVIGFAFFRNNVINSYQWFENKKVHNYVGIILADWPIGMQSLEKSIFSQSVHMRFGSCNVSIPKYYDKILKIWYGNYNELPREELRYPKHRMTAFWKD